MLRNKLALPGTLLLALFFPSPLAAAQDKDISTLQTALRIAQDELAAAGATRDMDARRVAATGKEVERLNKQLEAEREKAAQSEQRYLESRKRYDQARTALDQAWKR